MKPMKMTMRSMVALLGGAVWTMGASAATPLMSVEWTAQACAAWNTDATLTDGLAESWIKNDKGRGYKIIQMYRTDCGQPTMTEMKIVLKDNKAVCAESGPAKATPDFGVDYRMHAETTRWREMGAGDYGPMRAMMFGRLKFEGPKLEAMSVMGPFEAFLLLPGKVAGDGACPAP